MNALWLILAVLATAVTALVNTFDAYFLNRRVPGLRAYLLIIGILTLVAGLVLLALFPPPATTPPQALAAALFSALIRAAAVMLLLYALQQEDVARIIPLSATAPIFVAVMAVPLLGEALRATSWLAIGMVVGGAVLISFKHENGLRRFHGRTFWPVIASSICFAVGDVSNKYALLHLSYLNSAAIMFSVTAAVFLLFAWRRRVWHSLKTMPHASATLLRVSLNQGAVIAATILSYWVIAHGPVALASTVFNSKPFFVFIYALLLGRLAPGFLPPAPADRVSLLLKGLATALIVGGIALIMLT